MAKAKGWRDGVGSNDNKCQVLSPGEVPGGPWQGPRAIFLQKKSQGFGFTLRHFIVYPPESSLHNIKDEENGNAAGVSQQSRLEPMDTIFVKSVKENGPAQQAGLCTGDRLLKVNGESILGKTYSQVIALIQNSQNILELFIMPKDEDVLQLAYSQDAYLKGNEPYSDEAQNLPEPPPPHCYPPTKTSSAAQHPHHSPLDNWQCRPGPTTSPLDNRPPDAPTPLTSGWTGGPENPSSCHFSLWGRQRGRSSSAVNALDFHFANHNAAIASATLPAPRKSGQRVSAHAHADALCHQALSDWYYSQAEAAEHVPPRHRSLSEEDLAELGLGSAHHPEPTTSRPTTSAEQRRRETILYHHQRAAAAAHESHWLHERVSGPGPGPGPGSRSCSESLLAAYAEYEHNYGRSVETLAKASALVSPHCEHSSQGFQVKTIGEQKDQKVSSGHQHKTMVTSPVAASSVVVPPSGRQSGQQVAEPQTRRVQEKETFACKSYSPSFSGHVLQQAHSFREPSPCGPHLSWRASSGNSPVDSEDGMVPRPRSTPALSASEEERARLGENRELMSPISLHPEVVLRQKVPPGRRTPVGSLGPHKPHSVNFQTTPSPTFEGPGPNRRANGTLAQYAYNSLSSIPFIGSIKSRRSSYLMAITTERSKSCEEGLNTFREDASVFSKLPKRVKSFFTDGSLESLQAQEEARSKRHSTSELGTITFSDVRKEGWLHYKQVLTEKGKKVGGGMRPWKRAFSVFRSHSLFLYKDKREALLHGAGAGPGQGPGAGSSQDEHPPISIHGCLIDIAYSDTKRKHTLRLTTQDFCEYLLQAEDREDMLAWIRVIRENSKADSEEIGFSRQALINKKLNDYRKQSLTGNKPEVSPRGHRIMSPFLLAKTDNTSVNLASRADDSKASWGINLMKKARRTGSPKAFGVRLEDCPPALHNKFVPLVVEMCCGMVEATGLEYTGVYRVPGNNAMVSNLQEHLNKGMDINTAEERWQDLNVISSLLKSFFRKLPEPLFTDEKYCHFIDANRIADTEERLKTMKKLIHDLPNYYYHTLKFLVGHLKRVADHSEKNKMEPRNLALVFGPTLVRTSEDNMTDMVTHMPDRYKIVETLIVHHDWFFSNGVFDEEEKAPEDKQDVQSVPNIEHLLSNIGRAGMPGEASVSPTRDTFKSKFYSGTKKDLDARDTSPTSVTSGGTRKRKQCLSGRLHGSSTTNENSDYEPVKAGNYKAGEGGGGGGTEEERDGRAASGTVNGEHTIPKKEKRAEDGNERPKASHRPTAKGKHSPSRKEEVGKEDEGNNGKSEFSKKTEGENRQRKTVPGNARQFHSNSLPYSQHQTHATYPRPPTTVTNASNLRFHRLARGHSTAPLWLCPSRLPNIDQAPSISRGTGPPPDWNQSSVTVRHRKTRGGRTRAVSMNLDLEVGRRDDRGWDADRVEVIRVVEATPAQRGRVGVPQKSVVAHQTAPLLPRLAQERPPLLSSGWTDQSSQGSSSVVLRRLGLGAKDKTRAWRRHTLVV